MEHFEAELSLLFRQIEIFKISASERRLRHRELKKGKIMREFDTGDILVVGNQVMSSIKYGVSHKLVFKTKVTYIVTKKATTGSYWFQHLIFCKG